jgi:predicted Fe-S protein YdhL (DUF1289 family)
METRTNNVSENCWRRPITESTEERSARPVLLISKALLFLSGGIDSDKFETSCQDVILSLLEVQQWITETTAQRREIFKNMENRLMVLESDHAMRLHKSYKRRVRRDARASRRFANPTRESGCGKPTSCSATSSLEIMDLIGPMSELDGGGAPRVPGNQEPPMRSCPTPTERNPKTSGGQDMSWKKNV